MTRKFTFEKHFEDFIHPSTYVNKLLFSGGEDGGLQLWNIMSDEKIFDFKEHIGESVVSCVEQSPVVDIVAVGLENGEILLMNLLYNQVLLKFNQSQDGGKIKKLSFSSDLELGVSLLASITESENGSNVVFWDLN